MKYEPGKFYQLPKNLHKVVNSPYAFSVLCFLIQHANDDGDCFLSQDTLSQSFMSTKQVKRATAELKSTGILSMTKQWVRGGGIRIFYKVNFDTLVQRTDSLIDTQSSGLTVQSLTDSQSK